MSASKSLKDQLQRFLEAIQRGGRTVKRGNHWFSHGRQFVGLDDDEDATFWKLARLLRQEFAPSDETSKSAIVSHLNDSILFARSPLSQNQRGRAEAARALLLSELERPIRPWNVFFPLTGIRDDCLPLLIGAVKVFPSTHALADEVLAEDTPGEPSFTKTIRAHARREMKENFDGAPWARVSVRAREHDHDAAQRLALAELELTMDVINFFADIFRPGQYRSRVELAANATSGFLVSSSAMEGTEPAGVGKAVVGSLDWVWLPDLDTEEANAVGLDRAHRILLAAPRTEVEERVLAGLRWGGHGTAALRLSDKFLAFMMALESVVNGPSEVERIARTLESRCAQLLSGDNTKSRHNAEVQRLYDLRSRLVHAGSADLTEYDVEQARDYAKECTVKILSGAAFVGFQRNAELDQWFAPLAESASSSSSLVR